MFVFFNIKRNKYFQNIRRLAENKHTDILFKEQLSASVLLTTK